MLLNVNATNSDSVCFSWMLNQFMGAHCHRIPNSMAVNGVRPIFRATININSGTTKKPVSDKTCAAVREATPNELIAAIMVG
jgi:hypothetical protein